jgi:hypothetical protein
MHNTEDKSPWDSDLEDTIPPTLIPAELRATLGVAEEGQQAEPPDTIHYRAYDQQTLSQQDEITTPAPFPPPPEEVAKKPRPPRSSVAIRVMVGLCLVISLVSLALNGLLIYNLMNTRQTAVEGLDAAINALDSLGGKGFHYEYRFQEVIPFSGDIPFKQDLVFPFEGDIPINTVIEVPINVGIQTFLVKVPIDTSVYINTSVPIHVDQTVHVSTTIPLSMTIPIDVKAEDPAVQDLLRNVREWLVRFKESF